MMGIQDRKAGTNSHKGVGIMEAKQNVVCPFCGKETIIGDSSVYPMKKIFLQEMKKFWAENFR